MEKLISNNFKRRLCMVLVFIFGIIIVLIALISFLIISSTLEIKVQNINISNITSENTKLKNNFKIIFLLKFFGKITWLKLKIDKEKLEKIKAKIKIDKNKIKKLEKDFKLKDIKQMKIIYPKLTYLNLEGKIGFIDVLATSYVVAILCSAISILLPNITKIGRENKCYYKIEPLYLNQNIYKIKLNCIFEIKMVHIINMIYYFIKKRRGENHEQRTSNRRAYGYSYE